MEEAMQMFKEIPCNLLQLSKHLCRSTNTGVQSYMKCLSVRKQVEMCV